MAAEIGGDIAAAGSAVAGLILVYIGALSASFGTYQPQEKRAVRPSFQRRAWFAFAGLVILILSVALALIGKWLAINCLVLGALTLLGIGLAWVIVTAALTVMEIK